MICELYLLLLFAISRTNSESCPSTYFSVSAENTCLHVSTRAIKITESEMESYCTNEAGGGKPLLRRLNDDGFKDMAEQIWENMKNQVPGYVYIGIQRDTSYESKKWIFTDDDDVKQSDYPLWASDPSNYDCGVATKTDFKVTPYSCGQNALALCEKDKDKMPCRHDSYNYRIYHKKCLFVYPQQQSYSEASPYCVDGHIFPYKDTDSTKSVASAILTQPLDGGVYVGLKKQSDGSWKYGNGVVEKDRWKGDDKEWDCGMVAFEADFSFGLFSFSCDDDARIFCEYRD